MARSLPKLSKKDLVVKILAQDPFEYQNSRCATARAIRHAEGCGSDLKIRKVTRGWHTQKMPAPRKMNIEHVKNIQT